MSDHSAEVEDIARVIRARIGGEASAADDAAGVALLAARIRQPTAVQRSWQLGTALALVAACVALFSYVNWVKLSYVQSSAASGTAASSSTSVAFSDGSRIDLAAGAVGRVESTSARGAVFELNDGALEASVVHRQLTHWAIKAGPFTVNVKGTRFAVAWSRVERRFVLTLHEGAVEVRGDLLREGQMVRTGERLVVDLAAQRSALEKVTAPAAPTSMQTAVVVSGGPAAEGPSAEVAPPALSPAHEEPQASNAVPVPTWAERVASGDFRSVVVDAERRGADKVLTQASSADLSALADAARYTGDRALATKALVAQRQRFAGSERAAMAAFLLGKLSDENGNAATAADFYARYLGERPSGTFAQEALGRRMLALRGVDTNAAAAAAHEYLTRFPQGPRAAAARQITDHP